MKTIYQLSQIASRLRDATEVGSIGPQETFGLQADVLEYIAGMERNENSLGLRKVYKSYDLMLADSNAPVGSNGKELRFGQLVSVFDPSNPTQAENGNVYAYQKGNTGAAAWSLTGNLAILISEELRILEEFVGKTISLLGYYVCSTVGATAEKYVEAEEYELTNGGNIRIKMTHANTAASGVTLQIGSAAAKDLYYNGEPVSDENTWQNSETIVVYYDGTSYYATNSLGGGKNDLSQFFNVIEEQVGGGSANLIDPSKYVDGIVAADGSIAAGLYKTTDYIEVEESETYTFFANVGSEGRPAAPNAVCYYGASKEVVSYISSGLTTQLTVPTGAKYVRISKVANGLNPTLTGLIKGANLTTSDFVEYEPLQSVENLELNDGGKVIDEKTDDELVTKKNLVDYVHEQIGDMPDTSALESLVAGIKQKTDLLTVVEEQVGGSSNLLNPTTYSDNYLLESDGSLRSANGFYTTDFIEVEIGKSYYIWKNNNNTHLSNKGNPRFYGLYDSSKLLVGTIQSPSGVAQLVTIPSGAKYVRITFQFTGTISEEKTNSGLLESSITEFEVWSEPAAIGHLELTDGGKEVSEKSDDELATIKNLKDYVEEQMESVPGGGGGGDTTHNGFLTLSKRNASVGGRNIDIIRVFEDSNYIDSTFDKFKGSPGIGANVFNFVESKFMSVTSIDTDDVPAIHMKGNILGGNHSVTCIRISRTSHGLTNRDIGGVMTDELGQDFVILRIKDADNIYIMSLTASNVYGSYKWNNKDAASVDKTGQVTYNNQTTTWTYMDKPSVFPSTCEQTQKIIADGVDVTDSQVSINADVVDIVDNYNIVDFNQARNILMNRYGEDGEPIYESPLDVRLESVYRFMKGLKVIVTQSIIFANNTNFLNFAFADAAVKNGLQSSATTAANLYKSKLYVPGSKKFQFVNLKTQETVEADYSKPSFYKKIGAYSNPTNDPNYNPDYIPIDRDSSGMATYNFTTGKIIGGIQTPNQWQDGVNLLRIIQINEDNVGFVLGFLPIGVCASSTFLADNYWPLEVRGDTMKFYPHPLQVNGFTSGTIPAGCYTSVGYRVFFDAANQGEGRICLYDVDYDGYKYVFVDYNQTIFDYIELDNSLNGHSIELVEQRNAVLTSPVYNGGFYVNATHVNGDSSYCVVKIKL